MRNLCKYCWHQSNADTPAPEETSREEINEPVSDNESDRYPDDDIPEDEDDDDEEDEDDDRDEHDYKVSSLNFSSNFCWMSQSYFWS